MSYARARVIMIIMKFKKTIGLIGALTISASAFSGVLPLTAKADDPVMPPSVEATSPVTFNGINAELLLPATYEQYLPLQEPAYIAMNEEYIAIADNSLMYIYDKNGKKEYSVYKHTMSGAPISISKIQFTDDGKLYFRDNINDLYQYDFESGTSKLISDMSSLTFLIHGDYMYMAYATPTTSKVSFTYVPVNDMNASARKFLAQDLNADNPRMAYENDTLYCIINNNTVNAYNGITHEYLNGGKLDNSREQISDLKFVCAYKNNFFYTVNGTGLTPNGLYRTDHEGNAVCIAEGDGYSTITSYGDKLYCIQGNTIREMSVTEDSVELTGYEIAIDSDSPHRLANSGETVRTKDFVAIADTENKRVSLYNRPEKSYATIKCIDENGNPFTPEHIAINKEEITVKANDDVVTSNKIAVSNDQKIYEYVYERHSLFPEQNGVTEITPAPHETLQSVKGLNYVYGECYYITDYDGYGSLGNKTSNELHFNGVNTPTAITSDVYGTIYVAFGNKVYTFSEDDFKKDGASGTLRATLSTEADPIYASLTVDYEGNIWYIDEGNLYRNDLSGNNDVKAQIDGNDFVYTGENNDYPSSFALSFEDDEIYFNFKNYVVKTNAYGLESLPSLNKITAGEAKEKTFDLAESDNLFVKVPEGSVGFQIDLNALKTTEKYFPYVSYFRTAGVQDGEKVARRGVLLCELEGDDGYYVVALYDAYSHSFTANLFKKSKNNLEKPEETYFKETEDTAYISSSVSLCSAPSLFIAPDGERLSPLSDHLLNRGSVVNVLGFAEGEDREYALVEVVSGDRINEKGYVPRSYLTKTDPLGVIEQKYQLGYLRGDAGIILKGENGEELKITDKTEAKLYKNEDGTYTAVVEKDGIVYSNTVLYDQISHGETDALRISLIVILSVLALVIVGGYAFLMFPRKKKK